MVYGRMLFVTYCFHISWNVGRPNVCCIFTTIHEIIASFFSIRPSCVCSMHLIDVSDNEHAGRNCNVNVFEAIV